MLGLDQKKLLQENSVSRSQHCALAQLKAEEDLRVVGCGICSFAAIWVEFAHNEQIVCPPDVYIGRTSKSFTENAFGDQ